MPGAEPAAGGAPWRGVSLRVMGGVYGEGRVPVGGQWAGSPGKGRARRVPAVVGRGLPSSGVGVASSRGACPAPVGRAESPQKGRVPVGGRGLPGGRGLRQALTPEPRYRGRGPRSQIRPCRSPRMRTPGPGAASMASLVLLWLLGLPWTWSSAAAFGVYVGGGGWRFLRIVCKTARRDLL